MDRPDPGPPRQARTRTWVHTFKTYNKGKHLFYENGKLTPYDGVVNPIPPDVTAGVGLAKVILAMNEMAKTVPLEAPWTAQNAPDWDGQTFETFKRGQGLTPGGANLLDLAIEAVFACEPRDVSLLHVLFYTHSAGNETTPGTFDRLITTGGGAQDSRFVGGSQLVSIRAAKTLGGRVLLSQPVRRIAQGRSGVTVYTDELAVKGKAVIVTGPPSLTALIRYEPDLPALRAQLLQRFPQGSAIKVEAVYSRPFWRDHGLAGQVTSDTGPIKLTYDNSPPGRLTGRPARIRRGARGTPVRHAERGRASAPGARLLRALLRIPGRPPQELHRDELVDRAVDAWLLWRLRPARRDHRLWPRAAGADRSDPLGRGRNLGLLKRLYGRRGPVRGSGLRARRWPRSEPVADTSKRRRRQELSPCSD